MHATFQRRLIFKNFKLKEQKNKEFILFIEQEEKVKLIEPFFF